MSFVSSIEHSNRAVSRPAIQGGTRTPRTRACRIAFLRGGADKEGGMQQTTLIALIEDVAPPAFAAPWDKSGIQVASSRDDIHHLAVSLDPTPDAVRRAVAAGADMLLTHHPLTLEPRYPDRLDAYHEVLALLFQHNMPLYAAHTSLDANPEGPASWLPEELGMTHRCLLETTATITCNGREQTGGFGCVGDLPAPLTVEQLAARLFSLLPAGPTRNMTRLAGTPPSVIRRVAVCTGSGTSLAPLARQAGAELFITGDMKYHTALDLNSENMVTSRVNAPMAVLDVGHFSLEEEMTRRLAALLTTRLPGVSVTFLPGRDPFSPCPPLPLYRRYCREPLSGTNPSISGPATCGR